MPRISVFQAKDSRIVLLIRHDRSKNQYEFIRWDLNGDLFTEGQWLTNKQLWLKGSCISPDGKYFFYQYNTYQISGEKDVTHVVLAQIPNATAVEYRRYDNIGRWQPCQFDDSGQAVWPSTERGDSRNILHSGLIYQSEEQNAASDLGETDADDRSTVQTWQDALGRQVTIRNYEIYINDSLIYDCTNHAFSDRKPS